MGPALIAMSRSRPRLCRRPWYVTDSNENARQISTICAPSLWQSSYFLSAPDERNAAEVAKRKRFRASASTLPKSWASPLTSVPTVRLAEPPESILTQSSLYRLASAFPQRKSHCSRIVPSRKNIAEPGAGSEGGVRLRIKERYELAAELRERYAGPGVSRRR